jgi:hypothetical protein
LSDELSRLKLFYFLVLCEFSKKLANLIDAAALTRGRNQILRPGDKPANILGQGAQ